MLPEHLNYEDNIAHVFQVSFLRIGTALAICENTLFCDGGLSEELGFTLYVKKKVNQKPSVSHLLFKFHFKRLMYIIAWVRPHRAIVKSAVGAHGFFSLHFSSLRP